MTRTAYDAVADVYAERFTATEPEQPLDLAMIDHFAGLLTECRPQGVDLSPEMVRRARSDHAQYPCIVGSLTDLDYPDAAFEGVFSWYSTIHNPDEDLDRMIAGMVRVLRPGGALLVAFQVGEGMRRVGQGFAALGYDIVMNRYHRTRADMVARLEAHGLEIAAQMERGPVNSESDPQAVVIARSRPT